MAPIPELTKGTPPTPDWANPDCANPIPVFAYPIPLCSKGTLVTTGTLSLFGTLEPIVEPINLLGRPVSKNPSFP